MFQYVGDRTKVIGGAYTSCLHLRMSTPPLRSLLAIIHLDFMDKKCTLPIIIHTQITWHVPVPVRWGPHQGNRRSIYIMFTLEDVDPTSPITTCHHSPWLYGQKMHFTHNYTHTNHLTCSCSSTLGTVTKVIGGAYTSCLHLRMSTPPLRSLLAIIHLDFMDKKCTLPIIIHTQITWHVHVPVRWGPHQGNRRSIYIMFTLEDVDPTSPITTCHHSPWLYGQKMHFTHIFWGIQSDAVPVWNLVPGWSMAPIVSHDVFHRWEVVLRVCTEGIPLVHHENWVKMVLFILWYHFLPAKVTITLVPLTQHGNKAVRFEGSKVLEAIGHEWGAGWRRCRVIFTV